MMARALGDGASNSQANLYDERLIRRRIKEPPG